MTTLELDARDHAILTNALAVYEEMLEEAYRRYPTANNADKRHNNRVARARIRAMKKKLDKALDLQPA